MALRSFLALGLVAWVAARASAAGPDAPHPPAAFSRPCAAVAALSPSESRERAAASEALRWVSWRLDAALDRLVLARRLAQGARPEQAEAAARLARSLYADAVVPWLDAKGRLCACPVFGSGPPPACAELGRQRRRAGCEGVPPHRGRGIDVCRLVKGR